MKILLFLSHLIKLLDFAYIHTHIEYEYISAFTSLYINHYSIFLMNIKNVDEYDTNLGFQLFTSK